MSKIFLILISIMTFSAFAYQDLGYRFDNSRKGCYDQMGAGNKKGYNHFFCSDYSARPSIYFPFKGGGKWQNVLQILINGKNHS